MPGERIGNSNQYLTISGVVSAPAYSWASDNDTGLYRIGANNIGIAANGTKVLDISNTAVTITPATTLSAALTYGGITLSNSVTGTGSMVLSASPTFTGTVAVAAVTATSLALGGATLGTNALAVTGTTQLNNALNYGGVTLSNAVTGTGNMVLSASPTLTGTLTAAAANFSGTVAVTGGNLNVGNVLGSGVASFYKDNTPSYVAGVGTVVPGGSAASALIFSDYQGSWVERMRLDASGRLGINTSTPSDFLTVAGGLRSTGATPNANVTGALFDYSGGNARLFSYTSTGSDMLFYTNANAGNVSEKMRITSAGLVGIGMTPSNVLDITQNQNGASVIKLLNNSAGANAQAIVQLSDGTNNAYMAFFGTGGVGTGPNNPGSFSIQTQATGGMNIATTAAYPMKFHINNAEAARFNTSGVLLLGETSSTPTGGGTFRLGIAGNIKFDSGGTIEWPTSGGVAWYQFDSSGALVFQRAATEAARFDTSRNFLVGTTTSVGSLSNTAIMSAGRHQSFSGTATIPNGGSTVTLTTLAAGGTYLVGWQLGEAAGIGVWISGGGNLSPQQGTISSGNYYTASLTVSFTVAGFSYSPSTAGNCVFTCGNSTGGSATLDYVFTRLR